MENLNGILRPLRDHVHTDKDGTLTLRQDEVKKEAPNQVRDIESALIEDFQAHTERIVENIHAVANSNEVEKKHEGELARLRAQIDELNNEVMKIPVLKQRIEDQSLKIEAKDRKLKRYEEELTGKKPEPASNSEKKDRELTEKVMSDKLKNSARIQKLLEVRRAVAKMASDHQRSCNQEQLKNAKLKSTDDGYAMEVGEKSCDRSALINFSMIAICDELNHLGYSDGDTPQQQYVIVPILLKKKQEAVDPAEVLNFLFGGAGGKKLHNLFG